jgi:cytochrome c oxidase cbb3-type subunit IV
MTYHIFREIADSWVLLMLVGFFVGAVIWAFRPRARTQHQDASAIPFRHEHTPGGRS